jgi:hypothetical protein
MQIVVLLYQQFDVGVVFDKVRVQPIQLIPIHRRTLAKIYEL